MSANPSLNLDEPLFIDEIINEKPEITTTTTTTTTTTPANNNATVQKQKKKISSQDFPPLSASSTYKPVAVAWGKNIKPPAPAPASASASASASSTPAPTPASNITFNSFPSLSSLNGSNSPNHSAGSSTSSTYTNGSGFLAKNKKIQESFSLDNATQLNVAKPEFSKIVLHVKSTFKVSVESTLSRNGRTFLISGLPADVALARRELVRKLTKPVSIQLTIPTKSKSAVIGQGGKTIREIIDNFNVKIDVNNDDLGEESYDEDLDDTLSLVVINGDLESVQHAKARILEISNEFNKFLTVRVPIKQKLVSFLDLSECNIVDGVDSKLLNTSSSSSSSGVDDESSSQILLQGDRESVKASKANILQYLEKLDQTIIEKTVPVLKKLQFTINQKDIKDKFQVLVIFKNDSAIFSGLPTNVDSSIDYARNVSKKYIIETLEISKAHNKNLEHAKNLGLYFYVYQKEFSAKFNELFPNVQLMFMDPEQLEQMETVTFKFSSLSDHQNELKTAKKYLIQLVSNLSPSKVLVIKDLDYEIFGKEIKRTLNDSKKLVSFVQNGDYYTSPELVDICLLIADQDAEEDDDDDFKPSDEEYVAKLKQVNDLLDPLRKKQDSLFTEVLDIPANVQAEIFGQASKTEKLILEHVDHLQIKKNTPQESQLTLRGEEKAVNQVAKIIKSILENPNLKHSIDFEVPTKVVSRLIGNKGSQLNQTREKYGVSIDVEQSKEETTKITLTGLQYNMDLCKHYMLNEAKKWSDIVTKELIVPKKYKGSLIGSQGYNIKKLIEKYNVSINVQDDGDFVFIRGPSRGANKCFEEMNELLDFIRENSHVISKQIALKYVPRIIGKSGKTINDLKDEFGVELDFQGSSDEAAKKGLEEIELQITGTKNEIKQASAKIDEIIKNVDDFVIEKMVVDPKHFKYIIGQSGSNLREIMSKTGADMLVDGPRPINIPNVNDGPEEPVVIQGPKKIVDKIVSEISKIVENLENRVTKEFDIPVENYGSLIGPGGVTLRNLESTFNVSLQIPKKTDPTDSKVTISGLEQDIEKCIAKINKDIIRDTAVKEVAVPAKYHAFVSQHGSFTKTLSTDYQVFVKFGDRTATANRLVRNDFKKLNSYIDEVKQQAGQSAVFSLIKEVPASEGSNADDTEIIPWKLNYEEIDLSAILGEEEEADKDSKPKATKEEILAKAAELVESRVSLAQEPQFYGFVYASNPSKFSRVLGYGGIDINLTRKRTGCIIEVPKKTEVVNDVIVIKGTKEGVEQSIELIKKKLGN